MPEIKIGILEKEEEDVIVVVVVVVAIVLLEGTNQILMTYDIR